MADEAAAQTGGSYRNLKTAPFTHSEDPIATGRTWEEWLYGTEREFRYFQITEDEDKKDALIIFGGREIDRLEKSLSDPVADPPVDAYKKLKNKLNDYFMTKKNIHHARFVFSKMRPATGVATVTYAVRESSRLRLPRHDGRSNLRTFDPDD